MKATTILHNVGQSLWLDNITRDLLDQGTLKQYIAVPCFETDNKRLRTALHTTFTAS